jgi:hypothetical protein
MILARHSRIWAQTSATGGFSGKERTLSLNLNLFSSGVVFLGEDWSFKVEDNLKTPIFGFLLESALEMNKLAFS